jgi:hypothetical protein
MATLDKLALKQNPGGMMIVLQSEDPKGFKLKLAELQSEIHHLQWACTRLQRANLDSFEFRGQKPGSDIRVFSEKVVAELGILQGWLLSAVETYFALVSIELGNDELTDVTRAWKKLS